MTSGRTRGRARGDRARAPGGPAAARAPSGAAGDDGPGLDAGPPAALSGWVSLCSVGPEIVEAVMGPPRPTHIMVEALARGTARPGGLSSARLVPTGGLDDPRFAGLRETLRREIARPTAGRRPSGGTATLISILVVSRPAAPPTRRGGLSDDQLARVIGYLEGRLREDVSLGEVAGLVRLSRAQFCRAFKASTGTTLHRWRTEARIARAKDLMRAGEVSLKQVAIATGFAHQSHFTTAFRRSVGVAPGAWRRALALRP